MPIKNRNLEAGTRLVARYKKQNYICAVEKEGEGVNYVLEDGRRFKSPSAAGSALMDGKAVNGWRFWSLADGPNPQASNAGDAVSAEPRPARAKTKPAAGKRMIYRLLNQSGVEEGKTRYYCNGCQKSFIVPAEVTPEACPAGHLAAEEASAASDDESSESTRSGSPTPV